MPSLTKSFLILLLALLIPTTLPHLYTRISLVYQNHKTNNPSVLIGPKGYIADNGEYEVKYKNVLRNCEDIVVDGKAGYAVLSCDKGRDGWNSVMGHFSSSPEFSSGSLHIYDYTRPRPTLEELRLLSLPPNYSFHPLGLSLYLPTSSLLIANHPVNSPPTIDIFSFSRLGNSATFIRSISSPLLWSPNSILQISASQVLVTNDHFFPAKSHPWLSKLETYLGLPFGSVVHIDLRPGGKIQTLARLPFANGIARLNGTTVAVASSSTASVYLYDFSLNVSEATLDLYKKIQVPFLPDNLHSDKDNSLIIAGHAHLSSFNRFARQRKECGGDFESERCKGSSATWIKEWREDSERDLYVGDEIDTGSKAVWDRARGVFMVVGLYGKGLLVWKGDEV